FATWAAAEYGLRADDRLSNHAPLHFDLSIFDYFAGIVAGAATVIIPEDYARLPASYAQLINDAHISVLFTVPYALIQLLLRGAIERFGFAQLRWVIFGGEPFAPSHLCALMARWPHVAFDNMYGPAEVNGVTHFTVSETHDPSTPVPIGHMANTAVGRVVNTSGDDLPDGEAGELLVASPTMMRGYWRQNELTACAFVEYDDADGEKQRFYRTGDVVRRDPDGCLHFIGRADRQVKVRGYRVELDDMELALTRHDAVEEGAAYAIKDDEGVTLVCAEVTLRDGETLSESELASYVKQHVPWYAAPTHLDITKQFPRTTSGKIDRRKLAELAAVRHTGA
ncbi:MAG: AMP-binding protein, partial [Pseudomonadota bacterium]